MAPLLHTAADRAVRYLNHLGARPVFPSPEAFERLADLGGTLPNDPTDPEQVLALLDKVGSPATVASAGGRYFGFVVGGTCPVALAATRWRPTRICFQRRMTLTTGSYNGDGMPVSSW